MNSRDWGGKPQGYFFVDLKLNFQAENNIAAVVKPNPLARMDTCLNTQSCALHFSLADELFAKAQDLGMIDMRQIAPTLARLLGVSLPTADAKPHAHTQKTGLTP